MITVLMGRTSSQSEVDLPNAYHITESPEYSDSAIADLLATGLGHIVASVRRGWLGVGRSLLLITRGALRVHFGPVACLQIRMPQGSIGRTLQNHTRPWISGTSINGHVGILPSECYTCYQGNCAQSAGSEVGLQLAMTVHGVGCHAGCILL